MGQFEDKKMKLVYYMYELHLSIFFNDSFKKNLKK